MILFFVYSFYHNSCLLSEHVRGKVCNHCIHDVSDKCTDWVEHITYMGPNPGRKIKMRWAFRDPISVPCCPEWIFIWLCTEPIIAISSVHMMIGCSFSRKKDCHCRKIGNVMSCQSKCQDDHHCGGWFNEDGDHQRMFAGLWIGREELTTSQQGASQSSSGAFLDSTVGAWSSRSGLVSGFVHLSSTTIW